MRNVLKGSLIMALILVLAACGSKDTVLMTTDDLKFTEKDYLKIINDEIYVEERRAIVLEKIAKGIKDDKQVEEIYQRELKRFEEVMDEEEFEEDDTNYIREQAELEAGLLAVYNDTGLITTEDIEKEYGEKSHVYEVGILVVENDDKKHEKIAREVLDKKDADIGGEVEKYGDDIIYNVEMFSDFDIPFEFEEVKGEKKGYVGEVVVEDTILLYKLEDVREIDYEDVRGSIIMKIAEEREIGYLEIFGALEEKGIVDISKELREYLELDVDKVQDDGVEEGIEEEGSVEIEEDVEEEGDGVENGDEG